MCAKVHPKLDSVLSICEELALIMKLGDSIGEKFSSEKIYRKPGVSLLLSQEYHDPSSTVV